MYIHTNVYLTMYLLMYVFMDLRMYVFLQETGWSLSKQFKMLLYIIMQLCNLVVKRRVLKVWGIN